MKSRFLCSCLAFGFLASLAPAQAPAQNSSASVPAEKSPADNAHAAIMAAARAKQVVPRQVVDLTLAAFRDYPADARFGALLPQLSGLASRLPKAEQEVFYADYARLLAAEMSVAGLTEERWEALASADLANAQAIARTADAPDLAAVRAKIDALAARRPAARPLASAELAYARLLDKADPAAALAHLQRLAAGSNQTMATQAAGELRVRELRVKPVEMKFTAADGRPVDLAQLRGKVVLIDFWATWCGPCIAELPNLLRVYEQYHDKGFEIVGISFDQAPDADPAKVRKFQKTAAEVVAFAKEKNMPWPQYYDGKYWENDFGRAYNIRGIPAMFLLDQNGLLVETNARGEKLESEVKRLLKL